MVAKPEVEVNDGASTSPNTDAVSARSRLQQDSQDVTIADVQAVRVASLDNSIGVPDIQIVGDANTDSKADATLKAFANQLYDRVRSGDAQGAGNILEGLSKADRAKVEGLYASSDNNSRHTNLRDDIKALDPVAYRTLEAVLDREDGKTNIAGNIMVALETARKEGDGLFWDSDSQKGSAMLRAVMSTMTKDGFAEGEQIFQQRYGADLWHTIENTPGITAADKQLLEYWKKGSDGRTAEDIKAMAEIAVGAKDLHMLQSVLTGTSDAARQTLQQNAEFMKQVESAFGHRNGRGQTMQSTELTIARDLIREGNISLATIVTGDKGIVFGYLDNNQGLQEALARATEQERKQFVDGRAASELLAQQPDAQLSPEQQAAKQYYDLIDGAFKKVGNEREQAIYRDLIEHGRKTLISNLADQHTEPTAQWLLGGFGGGHSMQNLMQQVENMSKEDHALLTDPKTRDQFRKQIEDSLKIYEPDQAHRDRIMALIDAKTAPRAGDDGAQVNPTYEESQSIRRSVSEVIGDNPEATPEARKSVAEAIVSMSPADAAKYKQDAEFRASVDKMFSERPKSSADAASAYLAQQLLKQVAETGAPPQLGPVEQFAQKMMRSPTDVQAHVTQVETLLASSPSLRAHMQELQKSIDASGPAAQLNFSPLDQNLYSMMSGPFTEAASGLGSMAYKDAIAGNGTAYFDMLRSGGSAFTTQKLYGEYGRIAGLPADQRAIREDFMTPEQRQIAAAVTEQKGEMTLADRMRSFVIGDGGSHKDFQSELNALTQDPQKRAALFDEYQRKYGGNLSEQFLAQVPESDRIQYKGLVTEQTAQQQFFERTAEVSDQGGIVLDASRLSLDRTLGMNQEQIAKYEAMRQKLPLEVQQAIAQQYSDSLKNFSDSQEKLAQAATDAVYVTAALATVVATWGATTPQLLALMPRLAAAGATVRPAMVAAIKGGDIEGSEVFKESLRGALEGASLAMPFPIGGRTAEEAAVVVRAENAASRVVLKVEEAVVPKVEERVAAQVEEIKPVKVEEPVPRVRTEEVKPVHTEEVKPVEVEEVKPVQAEEVMPVQVEEQPSIATRVKDDEVVVKPVEEPLPVVREEPRTVAHEEPTPVVHEEPTPVVREEPTVVREEPIPVVREQQPVPTVLRTVEQKAEDAARIVSPAAAVLAREAITTDGDESKPVEITPANITPEEVEPLPAVPVDKVEVEPLPDIPIPNDRLMALATVNRGEGPYQSAARILKEATGKRPDHKDVMALTRAIQRVYAAEHDGNGDMSGLRVKYQFVTPQNFSKLLAEVQDEKTRSLLMSFAKQPTTAPNDNYGYTGG